MEKYTFSRKHGVTLGSLDGFISLDTIEAVSDLLDKNYSIMNYPMLVTNNADELNQELEENNDDVLFRFENYKVYDSDSEEIGDIIEKDGEYVITDDTAKHYLNSWVPLSKIHIVEMDDPKVIHIDDGELWDVKYYPISDIDKEFVDLDREEPFVYAEYDGKNITAWLNAHANHLKHQREYIIDFDIEQQHIDEFIYSGHPIYIGLIDINENTKATDVFKGLEKPEVKKMLPEGYIDKVTHALKDWSEGEIMYDVENNKLNIYKDHAVSTVDLFRKPDMAVTPVYPPNNDKNIVSPIYIGSELAAAVGITPDIATEILEHKVCIDKYYEAKESIKMLKSQKAIDEAPKKKLNIKLNNKHNNEQSQGR